MQSAIGCYFRNVLRMTQVRIEPEPSAHEANDLSLGYRQGVSFVFLA